MVLTASIAVFVTLFYLVLWEPVFKGIEEQKQRADNQRQILSWMQNAAEEVSALKASGARPQASQQNQSISTVVERSAVSAGIRSDINKIEAEGKQGIKVQMKAVNFNRLLQWLGDLQNRYGVNVKNLSVDIGEKPGMVSARVTLENIKE